MNVELRIKAAEELLRAALVAGQDTAPHRAELDRLRAEFVREQAAGTKAAASAERLTKEATEAVIHRDAEGIAAEAAGRVQAFLANFEIEEI